MHHDGYAATTPAKSYTLDRCDVSIPSRNQQAQQMETRVTRPLRSSYFDALLIFVE